MWVIMMIRVNEALDNGLYLRPPMGWMSWARFRCLVDCATYPNDCISDRLFMEMADELVNGGWHAVGYEYINVDDCWQDKDRDPKTGRLRPDPVRFPQGIHALAEYVHRRGLKFGIYSDVGTKTCQGYPGSLNHFELDAMTFAEWGIDSLKLDGCFTNHSEYARLYPAMGTALNRTGRPIAYICSWPAYEIGHANLTDIRQYCNSWRNYDDIQNSVGSLNHIINWFVIFPYSR